MKKTKKMGVTVKDNPTEEMPKSYNKKTIKQSTRKGIGKKR